MTKPRPRERANHTNPARQHMTLLVSVPVDIGLSLTQAAAVIKGAFPTGSGIRTMQYKGDNNAKNHPMPNHRRQPVPDPAGVETVESQKESAD